MDTSNKTAMIRRFIAIGLTLLAILCMFWPAIASVDSKYRDNMKDAKKEFRDIVKDQGGKKAVIDLLTEEYYVYVEEMSSSDAKAAANAEFTFYKAFNRADYSLANLRTMFTSYTTVNVLQEKYRKSNYGYSYNNSDEIAFGAAMAVFLNITFWSLLLFGIGAAVLYFFNKTRALGVVFTVFAFINSLIVIIMMAVCKSHLEKWHTFVMTAPNASLFLIPVFALAAVIVYKRDPNAKDLLAKKTPAADPQAWGEQNAQNPQP